MTFRYANVLSLLVAVLASTHFLLSNIEHVKHFLGEFTISREPIVTKLDGHHHHHHDHKEATKVDICDAFPRDSLPPDTNTTTTLCVDRNGCCNFTTIQSAIDAVVPLNAKRSLIWINNGVYL